MNMPLDFRRIFGRREPESGNPTAPIVFGDDQAHGAEAVKVRLRRPILAGSIVVLVLVVGMFAWAAFSSVSGAVLAAGTVRVENNSKQVRRLDSGIIRKILVREGQRVRAGQLLIQFDDVQPRSVVQVYQSALDSAQAQIARFRAESADSPAIAFPTELLQRADEPSVATLLDGQRVLFASRMMLYRSQGSILRTQIMQAETQIEGLRAQLASTAAQSALIGDELAGVRELNDQGYAPRSRLLALQRNAAALKGQRGAQLSEIARTQEAIGQTRIQLAQLDEKRQTEAAEGLRSAQDKLTEIVPKLRAVQEQLSQTDIHSPTNGYVFNLTQFTEGGVAGAGERLLDIVPVNTRLIVTARVRPEDIADVRVGLPARVTLTAYNPRTTPPLEGRVILVSADATTDEQTRQNYYVVQVQIPPSELARAGPKVRLTPGMPANVAIVISDRTILDYLITPFTSAMGDALHER